MTTYNHVRDLLAEQSNAQALTIVPSHWFRLAKHAWIILLFQARLVHNVKVITREVEDLGLRLSGATHQYIRVSQNIPRDVEADILRMAQDAEAHFLKVRTSILSMNQLLKPSANKFPALCESLGVWNIAAVEAFEAAQELRWMILETQAQRDINQGRVSRFGSAADAIASLRS